jgi:glycosyltransferase involved in cell wall biosynthesis
MGSKTPLVSVIIPSVDGVRGGNVARLMDQLREQSFKDLEIVLVKNVRPNGKARNEGARRAKGKILVCIDDDVTLGNTRVIENLVTALSSEARIGLLGISKRIPDDSNGFQRKCARQIPRSTSPIYAQLTEGDLVDHMCLAVRRDLFFAVGMENEELIRGTDPDLRHRVRRAGYRIAIVPNSWGYHPMPATPVKLLQTFFRNGMGSAWVQRRYPHLAFHDAEDHTTPFRARTPRGHRLARFFLDQARCLASGHFFYFVARIGYAAGFLYGVLSRKSGDARLDRNREEAT